MPLVFRSGYFSTCSSYMFKTPTEVCMAVISERGVLSLWHLRVGFHTLAWVFQGHQRRALSWWALFSILAEANRFHLCINELFRFLITSRANLLHFFFFFWGFVVISIDIVLGFCSLGDRMVSDPSSARWDARSPGQDPTRRGFRIRH